jgi:iron complex transport system ATP-binding protein
MMGIRVRDVKYGYPGFRVDVLKGVTLDLPESEVTALLGVNGSGKTTLFKVMLKILTPKEGSILVGEKNINEFSRNDLSRVVALVPQEEGSPFPYTVFEYLLMGRAPHLGFFSTPTKRDEDKIVEVLADLGISHLEQRNVTGLSGGERRLVFIARALAQEPEILLVDEPTAHLDLRNKARVLGVMREMADSGRTVIFSTHDPNEASLVADEVGILNEGRIVGFGPPASVMTEDALKAIYGAEVAIGRVKGKLMVGLVAAKVM